MYHARSGLTLGFLSHRLSDENGDARMVDILPSRKGEDQTLKSSTPVYSDTTTHWRLIGMSESVIAQLFFLAGQSVMNPIALNHCTPPLTEKPHLPT